VAGETCWATLNRDDFVPGRADEARLNRGDRPGSHWVPAECDVSIRPGWFYHQNEDDKVRTAENLLELYFKSVGRGASFHLNLPVDRRGGIPEKDAATLVEFRRLLDEMFAHDVTLEAKFFASNVRNARQFSVENIRDASRDSYWTTDDGVKIASVTVEFAKPTSFEIVRIREYLPLGQRVESFALDIWSHGKWDEVANGTSVGNCRLIRLARTTTTKVRLRINAAAAPAISEFSLFLPNQLQEANHGSKSTVWSARLCDFDSCGLLDRTSATRR
jgi:alpha-L-fucosidase